MISCMTCTSDRSSAICTSRSGPTGRVGMLLVCVAERQTSGDLKGQAPGLVASGVVACWKRQSPVSPSLNETLVPTANRAHRTQERIKSCPCLVFAGRREGGRVAEASVNFTRVRRRNQSASTRRPARHSTRRLPSPGTLSRLCTLRLSARANRTGSMTKGQGPGLVNVLLAATPATRSRPAD